MVCLGNMSRILNLDLCGDLFFSLLNYCYGLYCGCGSELGWLSVKLLAYISCARKSCFSVLNPIIYGFFNENFKREFLLLKHVVSECLNILFSFIVFLSKRLGKTSFQWILQPGMFGALQQRNYTKLSFHFLCLNCEYWSFQYIWTMKYTLDVKYLLQIKAM